jgi:hypothetical protein
MTVAAVLLQQEGQAGKVNRLYVEVIPGPLLCVPQSNGKFKAVMVDQVPEPVQVHQ